MIWRFLVEDPRVPDMEGFVQLQETEAQRQITLNGETDKEVFEKLRLLPAQVLNPTYTWTIDDFSNYKDKDYVLTSESFTDDINDTKWHLDIEFKRSNISLALVSCNKHKVHTKTILSVLNIHEVGSKSKIFYKSFIPEDRNYRWNVSRLDIFNSESGFLPEDTLTVTCEIEAILQRKQPKFNHPKRPRLQTYMKDNVPYDVTLCVGDEELPAHRTMLACHSSVFETMFQHEMLERTSNRVEISDFEPRVFKELLEFMYTGSSRNLGAMVPELLAASDKFGVGQLKVLCEEQMFRRLNRKNVVETLKVAKLHNAHQLQPCVLDFIVTNVEDVMKSVKWNLLVEQDPCKAAALIEEYSSTE